METQQTTPESNDTSGRRSTVGLIIIIILLILGVAIFGSGDKVEAPTDDMMNDDEMATTTDDAIMDDTDDQGSIMEDPGVQVIQGDGFTATIRPVEATGPMPVIESFEIKQNGTFACGFSWDTDDAETCSFVNVNTRETVKNVGVEGNLQSGKGSYQLQCVGSGGMEAVSEVVVCQ